PGDHVRRHDQPICAHGRRRRCRARCRGRGLRAGTGRSAAPSRSGRGVVGDAYWPARTRSRTGRPGAVVTGTIRLLLADDQSLVRGALAALLDLEPDLEVVAEVGRGDEVVEAARRAAADVALLDVEMPGLDGVTAAAALQAAVPSC